MSDGSQLSEMHIVIVGGGPIGLEMAVAIEHLGGKATIFEAGSVGQTMSWWAPETRWFSSNERISIAGVPLLTPDQSKATREQYLTYLRGIVSQFELDVRTFTRVVDAKRFGNQWQVTTNRVALDERHFDLADAGGDDFGSNLQTTNCDAVVLAIGGTDFPRKLKVEGEELSHVDGYLREPHRYFGRRVLIVGGRNSAAEAALRLHHAGARVAISYRGDELPYESIKYWIGPELRGLIQSERIQAHMGTSVSRILPTHAVLRERAGGEIQIPADDVLLLIGYEQDKSLMEAIGVELTPDDSRRPIYDETTMQTSLPALYVAGTTVAGTQSSKYRTFLENCHIHIDRITAHLAGSEGNTAERSTYRRTAELQPES
ncbi:MAG: NAD(P)-binding domain-containing protein [Planctomycetota bacterium]